MNLADSAEACLTENRTEDAKKLCRQALERDPRDYKALVLLSYILRIEGEYMESAEKAERAVALRPTMVEAYFQLALNMLALGRFDVAASTLHRAIQLRPEQAVLHLNLGLAYEHLGRRELALRCYREAAKLNPGDLQAHLASISHLIVTEKFDRARTEIEAILRQIPSSPEANLTMAELCSAESGLAAAEPYIRKALKADPANYKANAMLGSRASELGNFSDAESHFHRSIEVEPNQGHAYLGLCQSKRLSEQDLALVEKMESIRDRSIMPPDESAAIRFALAKAYDNLGRYEEAMQAYDEAHRFAYLGRFGQEPFQPDRYAEAIDAIVQAFPAPVPNAQVRNTASGKLPILIVGMIRSGTTLTEQILSRHPRVGAAGEHLFWHRGAGTSQRQEWLAKHPEEIGELGENYIEELRRACPNTERVTDKLPGNYLRLGVVRSALPEAKIIHCRRNPVDNALSIYFTPIKTSSAFSHTKASIAFAYRQYMRLMDHWRQALPPQHFMEVQYEELVENPEPIIRQMLEFLELEWDEACLSPEDNAKEVKTASLWQVRQPIYRTSVERWRRYEPWLGELSQLIQDPSPSPA
jgi:tetratricopeptide (TPR) repeat protein